MPPDEKKLSKQSQEVLAILRTEIAAGRIPPEHAAFLAKAVRLQESVGTLSNFIMKLAGVIVAIGAMGSWLSWWPKK